MKKPFPCLSIVMPTDAGADMPWQLQDLGATAVETRDETTMTVSGEGVVFFVAGFSDVATRDAAVRELSTSEGSVEPTPLDISDDGWSAGWRSFFKPVVLERIQVVTPWMDPPEGDRISLVIDPGLAFGTGGHATTRLVLTMLERLAIDSSLPDEVVDVGIGSGILSIAAAMLGVRKVVGVDIDPESVVAVRDNSRANGVEDRIRVTEGTSASLHGEWPLLLANIELKVFQEHAGEMTRLVAPGGEAILSGLLEDQVDECIALWGGFSVLKVLGEDGWAAVRLRRDH